MPKKKKEDLSKLDNDILLLNIYAGNRHLIWLQEEYATTLEWYKKLSNEALSRKLIPKDEFVLDFKATVKVVDE